MAHFPFWLTVHTFFYLLQTTNKPSTLCSILPLSKSLTNIHPCQTIFRPWTRQTGSCGRPGPGDFISLPLDFVSRWNSSDDGDSQISGKLFAHEFIKLVLGIFDEAGHPGDPLYPAQFWQSGHWRPTGVSDARVQGDWVHPLTGQVPSRLDILFVLLHSYIIYFLFGSPGVCPLLGRTASTILAAPTLPSPAPWAPGPSCPR